MAKNGHSKFFSNNFSQKDWYKFGMAISGHSKFFLTIFPKKIGTNSEWQKMAIRNCEGLESQIRNVGKEPRYNEAVSSFRNYEYL